VLVVAILAHIFLDKSLVIGIVFIGGSLLLNAIIVGIDYHNQTADTETYSGKITSVKHIEEWDEHIPEKGHRDKKGNYIVDTPAHWEHHEAENYVTTSDNGQREVTKTPSGQKFTDSFVNSNAELQQYYPINSPTASIHTYENKVQASDSIYKRNNIDLKQYSDLPAYPVTVNSDFSITRIIGDIPNKESAITTLNMLNTNLNDSSNPNNKDGVKSYKQCNLIFVNLGDKPQEYAYALQDYWKNGKKNDFIVAFGTKDNKVTWCYPITWSDIESLKSDVKSYMLDKSDLNKFDTTIKDIGVMVESKYERKQFADFSYINIETGTVAKVFITIIVIACCIGIIVIEV
jgi:hypothetical protein